MKKENNKGGRPALPSNKKKKNRISLYLNDDDMEKLQKLKIGIVKHSPTLSLNDFFRLVIDNFDETLIPYLLESPNSEVKKYMHKNVVYKNIFENILF